LIISLVRATPHPIGRSEERPSFDGLCPPPQEGAGALMASIPPKGISLSTRVSGERNVAEEREANLEASAGKGGENASSARHDARVGTKRQRRNPAPR
jgi:hypothetical protein